MIQKAEAVHRALNIRTIDPFRFNTEVKSPLKVKDKSLGTLSLSPYFRRSNWEGITVINKCNMPKSELIIALESLNRFTPGRLATHPLALGGMLRNIELEHSRILKRSKTPRPPSSRSRSNPMMPRRARASCRSFWRPAHSFRAK